MTGHDVIVIVTMAWIALAVAILPGSTLHPVSSRGRHRANGWQWVDVTPIVQLVTEFESWRAASTEERRRAAVYESWMERRAVEAPFFARLAAEMGLGYALGVAA